MGEEGPSLPVTSDEGSDVVVLPDPNVAWASVGSNAAMDSHGIPPPALVPLEEAHKTEGFGCRVDDGGLRAALIAAKSASSRLLKSRSSALTQSKRKSSPPPPPLSPARGAVGDGAKVMGAWLAYGIMSRL